MVSNKVHLAALQDAATERGKREVLERQVQAQSTLISFMCARTNALETERAIMLRRITGLEIPIPTISYSTKETLGGPTQEDMLAAAGALADPFADMGDAEARRQGVEWDKNGHVVYGKPGEVEPQH